jgi:hypothetical protein
MNKDEENFNLKTSSSKKEKVKTESKNVKTKVSVAAGIETFLFMEFFFLTRIYTDSSAYFFILFLY